MGDDSRLNDDADDEIRYDIDEYDDKCDVFGVCKVEEKTEQKGVGNRALAPKPN